MDDYAKLLQTKEDLHKDLVDYLEDGDMFPMLRHPLVFHVPYFENMNAIINKQYTHKKMLLKKYIKDGDLGGYLFAHERPYRLNAFMKINHKFSDKEYWKNLNSIWTDSENIYQNIFSWKHLLNSDRKCKESFMSKGDLKFFKNLPETLTIYRGCTKGLNENGYSYTTERTQAEWFANRFRNGEAKVVELKVKKKDVFAYTNSRSENEIIIVL
jgi:hypothetical protein